MGRLYSAVDAALLVPDHAPASGGPPGEPGALELEGATLAACRLGDPAALRLFIARYQGVVFAFLSRSLGHGPHVEDLAQEVFIRACRALPDFDPTGPARLPTWVLTIASRLVIDARRRRTVPTSPLDSEVLVATPDTPETERRRMEIGRALEAAAGQLSDDQRDVFLLAEFHDLDMREIGVVLGIPENTVKTRLFRARTHLRSLLKDLWEDT
jgi:RNA polymerase sigma-70 factor (ECF subfamily)